MKLSIITVVYNGEKVIERAIKSVIRQKNADIEYIIVISILRFIMIDRVIQSKSADTEYFKLNSPTSAKHFRYLPFWYGKSRSRML